MGEVCSKKTDLTKARVSLRNHERKDFICMELGISVIDALEGLLKNTFNPNQDL